MAQLEEHLQARPIIVAEPDPELRHVLRRALIDLSDVIEEGQGNASLLRTLNEVRARGDSPLLVVVDSHLPGLSDLAFTTIKSMLFVPVLLTVSLSDDTALAMRARALGVDAVLEKPFELEELHLVARFLIKRAKRQSFTTDGKPGVTL